MSVEKKNIFLRDTNTSIPYISRSIPGGKNYPQRENSKAHATFIERKLNECYERSAELTYNDYPDEYDA